MSRAKSRGSKRSIIAVQHVRLMVVAVVIAVMLRPTMVPVVMVPTVMIAPAIAVNAFFAIDATRREVAGAGKGRALLDIVILRWGDRVMILHFRIRPALIAGVGLNIAAARVAWRAAIVAS